MIQIILNIPEMGGNHVGHGKSYGQAAINLIDKVRIHYGIEALDDGILFEALDELPNQENKIYSHFDMDVLEQQFTLTLVRE